MKTVTAFWGALGLVTVIYDVDPNSLRKFQKNYADCARLMNVSNEIRVDVAICAAILEGDLVYANGEYSRDGFLRKLEAWISDPIKLQQARELFFKCDSEATQSGALGIRKTMQFSIQCMKPILSIL